MAQLHYGDRVGRHGSLAVGCSAAVFDDQGRLLLARRTDNYLWAVPGGYMEPGESLTEACAREVMEETGLAVRVGRLIGAYTSPHRLLVYEDGHRWQLVVLHFAAEVIGGSLRIAEETVQLAYFAADSLPVNAMHSLDRRRALDSFVHQTGAIVCDDFAAAP